MYFQQGCGLFLTASAEPLNLVDTLESASCNFLEIFTEVAETENRIRGSMFYSHVVTLQSSDNLIQEFVDATIVRLFPIGKKTGKELETGNLVERLITRYPLVGDDRRIIYVLQKVEGKHLCHLLTLYLFHP